MPEWLKFFFATGSAVTLAGDPVMWVGDHRYHHLKSDTDEDIHPFEHHKVYYLQTPYDSFGAAQVLADALAAMENRS